MGGFETGCSICVFVSIQGHFPNREAGLSTPPLSGSTLADQSPPLLDLSRGKLGEGETDSKGRDRERMNVRVCLCIREGEGGAYKCRSRPPLNVNTLLD